MLIFFFICLLNFYY